MESLREPGMRARAETPKSERGSSLSEKPTRWPISTVEVTRGPSM
ncbi:MAG: hypothetical protein R3A52_16045 [Polyangiales bacterium]